MITPYYHVIASEEQTIICQRKQIDDFSTELNIHHWLYEADFCFNSTAFDFAKLSFLLFDEEAKEQVTLKLLIEKVSHRIGRIGYKISLQNKEELSQKEIFLSITPNLTKYFNISSNHLFILKG